MKSQPILTPRDWEALSAYLDGELNSKERVQLEQRLKDTAELRSALEEMRRTRTVLRSQPRMRAPRNFTLTPQMAGVRRDSRPTPFAFPVLRLASVLATIFFVIVLAGDLVARSTSPAIVAQAPQGAGPFWGGLVGGGGGGVEVGVDVQMKEAPPAEPGPATQESLAVSQAPSPYPEPEMLQVTPLPTETPAQDAAVAAELLQPAADVPPQPVETAAQRAPVLTWSILRALQVLLAALALCAGLGAWFVRRSTRL